MTLAPEVLTMPFFTRLNVPLDKRISLLTSAQRSAEVRALQRALSFYLYFYLSGYVCLQFVVYASLNLDRLPFSCV